MPQRKIWALGLAILGLVILARGFSYLYSHAVVDEFSGASTSLRASTTILYVGPAIAAFVAAASVYLGPDSQIGPRVLVGLPVLWAVIGVGALIDHHTGRAFLLYLAAVVNGIAVARWMRSLPMPGVSADVFDRPL